MSTQKKLSSKLPFTIFFFFAVCIGNSWAVNVNDFGATPSDNSDDVEAIQNAIDSLGVNGGGTIFFPAGEYNIDSNSIKIMEKNNITIEGDANDASILIIKKNIEGAIRIKNNVKKLTIRNLTIRGEAGVETLGVATFGIESSYGTTGVDDVVIENNIVENIAVGISVGGGVDGDYKNVIIRNNIVRNTFGDTPGYGYGIHNDNVANILIEANTITNVTRHSIYQAHNFNSEYVIIKNNIINNHAPQVPEKYKICAAINIARSSNVKLLNNSVNTTSAVGIFIGRDDAAIDVKNGPKPINNIEISENNLTDTFSDGILIKTNDPFMGRIQQTNGLVNFDLADVRDRLLSCDFDGDGDDDIICYRPGSGVVYIMRSNGDGSFANISASANGLVNFDLADVRDRLLSCDFDGDGDDDIICYRPGSGVVYIMRSNGDGSFSNIYASANGLVNFDLSDVRDRLLSCDYNGDGDDDIICYRPGSNKIVYMIGSNGDGSFSSVYKSITLTASFDSESTDDMVFSFKMNMDELEDICFYRPGQRLFYCGMSTGNGYTPIFSKNTVEPNENNIVGLPFYQENTLFTVDIFTGDIH